ncbi:hypothetical protein [Aquimarina megaterium]|uniref:hypothetical protein n=1 Tax=Aquimarina megaterium TaxID=1443666 RepID=UPI000942FA5A|nr:hypothetical protein [Aquimarina megaterium]
MKNKFDILIKIFGIILLIIPSIVGIIIVNAIITNKSFNSMSSYMFRMFGFGEGGASMTPLFFGLMLLAGAILLKNHKE